MPSVPTSPSSTWTETGSRKLRRSWSPMTTATMPERPRRSGGRAGWGRSSRASAAASSTRGAVAAAIGPGPGEREGGGRDRHAARRWRRRPASGVGDRGRPPDRRRGPGCPDARDERRLTERPAYPQTGGDPRIDSNVPCAGSPSRIGLRPAALPTHAPERASCPPHPPPLAPDPLAARRLLIGLFALTGVAVSSWLARIPTVRDRARPVDGRARASLLLVGSVGSLLTVTVAGGLVHRGSAAGARCSPSTAVFAVALRAPRARPGGRLASRCSPSGIFLNGVAVRARQRPDQRRVRA